MAEPWDEDSGAAVEDRELEYQRSRDLDRPLTEEEELILQNEESVEKAIQPVGFVPNDDLDRIVARAVKNGTLSTESEMMAREDEIQADLALIHEWLQANRPGRYFIPNVGQEKAILPLKDIDPDEPRILKGVFGGANMVGKTTDLVNLMLGVIWGRNEMNEFFQDWKIFEKFEKVRRMEKRALRLRIICHSGGMEDGGQVMEEITAWWPKGLYKWEKNHKAYYSVCKCWDMDGNLLAVINVRTHDQPRNAHAGHTLDGIFADEPLPKVLWAENHARLRTKLGGLFWLFLSPLDEASWIQDLLVNDPDVYFTNAIIWDNCSNYHPRDSMWSGGKVGVGEVLTRGTRDKKIFWAQIRAWEQEGVEIARARAFGEFTHFAGAVFKEFDVTRHVISPYVPPSSWPAYQIIDPHDGRPHLAIWVFRGPDFDVVTGISPSSRWDKIKGGVAIPVACKDWRDRENRFRSQILMRIGDPQKIKSPVAGKTMSSQGAEFALEGFPLIPGENDISTGISRIREALRLNKLKIMSHDPWTSESNDNVTQAFTQFCYKSSANEATNKNGETLFTQTWKDVIDVLRYFYSRAREYAPVSSRATAATSISRRRISRSPRPWANR